MYRVSPALNRFAAALLFGALLATLWVNLSPASYYDFAEWRIAGLPLPPWLATHDALITPISIVGEAAMALFIAIIAKELWEAMVMERGPLSGERIVGPMALMAGSVLGAVLVWVLLTALVGMAFGADEGFDASLGWNAPIGSDVVLCYLFGRMIFGPAHPALKLVLLISIAETLFGLLLAGLFSATYSLRLAWLILPFAAALLVWWRYGHRLAPTAPLRETQRADAVWPYIIAGCISWAGTLAAGLPGALGLLPILPAIAHADRSFGLFAEAEGLLHDPLNRLAHILIWPVTITMFAFGLTFGAIDLSAFGIFTVVMLAALWVGKPAGLFATAFILQRLGTTGPLMNITRRDLICIAPLVALAFTGPALGLPWTLPPGIITDAARLGLALSIIAGPLCLIIARKFP
jgi:Na+:H+ antiporter, NhaA family